MNPARPVQARSIRLIGRDLAFGIRLLRRTPSLAMTSALVVALGVGATTAIFSVVYGVVLRPPPFPAPDRLVALWTRLPDTGQRVRANAADQRDWRASRTVFEDIALAGGIQNFNLTGMGEPERVFAARMSANVFTVLGATPALGRTFTDRRRTTPGRSGWCCSATACGGAGSARIRRLSGAPSRSTGGRSTSSA